MALPDWVPFGMIKDVKLETIGPRLKLRGKHADEEVARHDFTYVIDHTTPPGYVLSRASIEAEHARGKRLCWEVVWLREEVAERRYQQSQEKLMSRFEVQT